MDKGQAQGLAGWGRRASPTGNGNDRWYGRVAALGAAPAGSNVSRSLFARPLPYPAPSICSGACFYLHQTTLGQKIRSRTRSLLAPDPNISSPFQCAHQGVCQSFMAEAALSKSLDDLIKEQRQNKQVRARQGSVCMCWPFWNADLGASPPPPCPHRRSTPRCRRSRKRQSQLPGWWPWPAPARLASGHRPSDAPLGPPSRLATCPSPSREPWAR